LLTVVFAPRKGLLASERRRQLQRARTEQEDILKQAFRRSQRGDVSPEEIRQKLGLSTGQWKRHLQQMKRLGWLGNVNELTETDKGLVTAMQLVRAHRLWETYLSQQMGLSEDQIHDEAERLEHLLTDEFLDAVDRELGYPTQDPHGSPIPPRA